MVLLLAFGAAACDDSGDSEGSGGGSGAAPKVYGPGDSIRVAKGQTFVIALEANPTTGYSWAAEPNENVEFVKSQQVTRSTLPGAPGVQRLTFRAVASGSSTLVLGYARPFEPNTPPVDTESFPVRVT